MAAQLRDAGFHIFPLCPASKKPAVKWGGKTLSPAVEPSYWYERPRYGIAVATGPASDCFLFDVDTSQGKRGADSLRAFCDRYGPLPVTAHALTGSHGLHFVFRWPDFIVPNSTSVIAPGIDIKGLGGYFAAPSLSRHPVTGELYRWLSAPWDVGIAPAPAWLLRAIKAAASKPMPKLTPPPDPERIRWARSQSGEHSPLARALRYMERHAPPSIEGQHGRTTMFGRAGVAVKAYALDDDDALTALRTYNARSVPPWTDDELHQFITEARANSTIVHGAWL
jgi:hypothetical protein